MKSLKAQQTSYKDFVQKLGKAKVSKAPNQFKLRSTPKSNMNSCASLHSQSAWVWDKCSPVQGRLMTQTSAQKKTKSYNQSHNQSIQIEGKQQTNTSKKDMMMCYHKFITQATLILTKLFKIPPPELLNNRISYIEYLEALKSLKLIYDSYEPYPNDLVSELWSEYISGYNVGNFIITVSAILGLYETKQSEDDKYLKHKYQSLKYTRLELHKGYNHQNYKENQYTFAPQISERSRKLALSGSKSKKQNRQILQSVNTDRALTDRGQGSVICYEKSKTSIDQHDENFYAQNLTEPPVNLKQDNTGNKRSQILYERAKQRSAGKRQNKTSNQIEYQKSKKQLTFKPKILKVKSKQKINNTKYTVRGEKNTISRMIRGRVQRQVRRIINQKGIPYNEKFVQKMKRQKYDEITTTSNFESISDPPNSLQNSLKNSQKVSKLVNQPKSENSSLKSNISIPDQDLIIDVYISEDRKQKLVIRKGESLEQVASRFIEEHGLSCEKKDQLIQLLEVSINHALCPIDELVEEEEELASARTHYKKQYCR